MNKTNQLMEKGQRNRLIAVGVLVVLFTLGMAIDEGDYLAGKHTGAVVYLQVYSAFLLLLVYIVPFCILMKRLCQNTG